MHRTLIVAKLKTDDPAAIAQVFAESDATDLPRMVGVARRTLFNFHDLYFHLVEAAHDIQPDLYKARSHPLYRDINDRLSELVSPYDPGWREPRDAMASPFYVWTSEHGRIA
ncbi:TcmI family type II polyketide cyclase [Actinoalloteichus hymeniacidonis]|uniref:Polyketide synthesis cyclase n=1 Tax=Actinoalloteichus hymeniacidonis TaxID=340345 RepID=A0AAC9HP64_9PSEU|nr:TcmI family type II polyketide cyclase [Actinoalloteichus hymeniacidonis]AOS62905.1 Polyketide synthesis cyclase [Actinoalloteichus hymeniacidonis]MBB5909062.1 cyclase [Actinoalloteichus hymeniacidonis]